MKLFHYHKWKEIARMYAPPYSGDIKSEKMSYDFAKTLFLGITTILWECEICHNIRREELLGKLITELT